VDSFYEQLGEGRYRATPHTAGPWSDKAQHLGPVSALLARELERCRPREDAAIRRISVDVLGPVPVDELEVTSQVLRPGRSVELVSAELSAGGRTAATARAWRMVRGDTGPQAGGGPDPLPDPGSWSELSVLDGWNTGYAAAVEWRFAEGTGPGRAQVRARARIPLLPDEEPSGLQRVLTIADSASGVSSRLDVREWMFINTDLTVHLHREPAGEWIGMDAGTTIGPDGAGTATSVLHDGSGPVGRGEQALLITSR
jgi:hypothetical protein